MGSASCETARVCMKGTTKPPGGGMGQCKVDGSTTDIRCCKPCHQITCSGWTPAQQECTDAPTSRPFSSTETAAILEALQSQLFTEKIKAEATLLVNELRSGSVRTSQSTN